jgi:DNA-binding NtrC family response regulator
MSGYSIFIVEDDPWYAEVLAFQLGLNPDFKITRFETAKECLNSMGLNPDLVTIDFSLPDMRGDELFQKIREINSQVPVVVISSQEDITVALDLMKMGVSDYLVKDDAAKDLLWNCVHRIRENQSLKKEVAQLKEELGQKFSFDRTLIGRSDALNQVFLMMERAAKSNITVSISGETGTGKELVAKAVHYNSERKKKSFVAVNMAAIPKELIESELFGHEKGAFTGAVSRKTGKFEEANGGTIFLDEIAEMDLSLQSKLLRVLQERELIRVGGNENVKLDVRVIVATHRDMAAEVQRGNFREDLYFRILGLPIHLPPLRERGNDILVLARHFVEAFTVENKMGTVAISQEAKEKLMHYRFPGNVRELKAVMDLSVVMGDGKEIRAEDVFFTASSQDEWNLDQNKTLQQYNCDIVKYFLKKADHDVALVAEKLDIGKSTIYKMLKQRLIEF